MSFIARIKAVKANVERSREKRIALFCLRQSLRNISSYSRSCDSSVTIHHCHDVGRKCIYVIVIFKFVVYRLITIFHASYSDKITIETCISIIVASRLTYFLISLHILLI